MADSGYFHGFDRVALTKVSVDLAKFNFWYTGERSGEPGRPSPNERRILLSEKEKRIARTSRIYTYSTGNGYYSFEPRVVLCVVEHPRSRPSNGRLRRFVCRRPS